jgi:superfamily II DNA or RNA helicase
VLVLTREVKPAHELGKELTSRGLKAEVVTGEVKGERRRKVFDSVESLDAIVADTIADEGLDLPQIRSLVITGGGASSVRTLQRVGRAVRPWKDKKVAIVVDVWDQTDYFIEHGYKRFELYKTEPAWRINVVRSKAEVIELIKAILAKYSKHSM